MVWYDMLCFPMVWYGMERMVCYEISMLCYAVAYVAKDKHSATVVVMTFSWQVDTMIRQVDLNNQQDNMKIWQVDITIWQVMAKKWYDRNEQIVLSEVLIKHTWIYSQDDIKIKQTIRHQNAAGISAPRTRLKSKYRNVPQITESCQTTLFMILFCRCLSRKLGPYTYIL